MMSMATVGLWKSAGTTAFIIFCMFGLLALCWTAVKMSPLFRIGAVGFSVLMGGLVGFGIGMNFQQWCFQGTHIHWFSRYSAHLETLMNAERYRDARRAVEYFNKNFKQDSADPTNLQNIVWELGRISQSQNETRGQPPK
jgi:hypothetical protein